jgi:transcriptional regulator with XRE-family HTH domain
MSRGEYLVTTVGDLGAALKRFRIAAGMTQEQAAELEGSGSLTCRYWRGAGSSVPP